MIIPGSTIFSVEKKEKKSNPTVVKLSDSDLALIKTYAESRASTVSATIRHIVLNHIQQEVEKQNQ